MIYSQPFSVLVGVNSNLDKANVFVHCFAPPHQYSKYIFPLEEPTLCWCCSNWGNCGLYLNM